MNPVGAAARNREDYTGSEEQLQESAKQRTRVIVSLGSGISIEIIELSRPDGVVSHGAGRSIKPELWPGNMSNSALGKDGT